ncbi:MAG: NUDIX hydrolase [Alphaproteobacteria bacterium]
MAEKRRAYPEWPLCGVGVLVWRGPIDSGEILLVRRTQPPRQGEWSLPGGTQEIGETCRDTARREVFEETGIDVEISALADVIDLIERDEEGRYRYHYTIIDFIAVWRSGNARPGEGVSEIAWARLDDLKKFNLWEETVRIIRLSAMKRLEEITTQPQP